MSNDHPQSPSRRTFARRLGALAAAGLVPGLARAAQSDVTVLTSYPDEVVARFEAAFERAFPQYRLRIVWRMPHDALPYLHQPAQAGVGVYWSPAARNFSQLKAEGAWRKLDIDLAGLPGRIGNTAINDPEGYFVATETAGYGFAVNPEYLGRHGLSVPEDWTDLAHASFAGHLVLPIPSQVGFAPVMVDIPLQAYGWQKGWAVWSVIAANARLVGRNAAFVSDEVASGCGGVGLTIDFFAASAIANGAPLKFVYPKQGGVNPAQIAITASCVNLEGARAFASFVLSEAGQKLLLHPDIRKLPVRPSVYAAAPPGYHNPFAVAAAGGYAYDSEKGRTRLSLIAAAFEQALVVPHARRVALWSALAKMDQKARADAMALFAAPPLSEEEAADPVLQRAFIERGDEATAEVVARAAERRWAAEAERRLDQLDRLVEPS